MKKRKIIFGSLFIILTLFIFCNSAKPADKSTEQSGFLVRFFMELFSFAEEGEATHIVRKAAHMAEFFAQAAVLLIFFLEDYKKYVIYVLFAGLLTAAADEFIQLFAEGRAGMIQDVFIDFSGTCMAVLAFLVLHLLRKRVKRV